MKPDLGAIALLKRARSKSLDQTIINEVRMCSCAGKILQVLRAENKKDRGEVKNNDCETRSGVEVRHEE